MQNLRIGSAQINCTVGDLKGNTRKICDFIKEAKKMDVDIVSFPEMAVTGYPPEDLLLKPEFIKKNLSSLRQIVNYTKDITAIVGFVDCKANNIYNAAAVINNGSLAGIYHKMLLPNYGVFDEKRYFQPGIEYSVFIINGVVVGVNICEDIWFPEGPTITQARIGGARIIMNINSSPYHAEKWKIREKILVARAKENSVFVAYNNMVGGQDELVFDGHGMIFDPKGNLIARGKQFEEDLMVADLDIQSLSRRYKEKTVLGIDEKRVKKIVVSRIPPGRKKSTLRRREIVLPRRLEEIYRALILGTKDYVRKNDFKKVVIGLSGGIDSSLTSAIAVDALGKENVIGVYMPSQYSSTASEEDAEKLAENLGIKLMVIPIKDTFDCYLKMLSEQFKNLPEDVTEENIQARIRGNILMALSNKFGWLVLSTGNKSETSVGYCTLYGDMAGGFAVIKDVPKSLVYELCKYRNSLTHKENIPKRVIEKEPTAELKPRQRDIDTLPPYEVLDPILHAYVEEDKSLKEIVTLGYEKEIVKRVIGMVDINEYKRRQAPPGIKITPKAFGKDRRMPITKKYEN